MHSGLTQKLGQRSALNRLPAAVAVRASVPGEGARGPFVADEVAGAAAAAFLVLSASGPADVVASEHAQYGLGQPGVRGAQEGTPLAIG